jgi:glycosyltransferase involved in cell wall biosynthesis
MIKDVLSIVIPCKNEEDYILETLSSIQKQKGALDLKVIIADAKSTDRTRDLIRLFAEKSILDIKIIDGGSVSYGRNFGASLVDTKYILFIDADTILYDDDIIQKTVKAIRNKKYDIVTCKIRSNSKSLASKLTFKTFNLIQRLMPDTFSTGVYMAVKKSDFDRLGGFDETVHQSEDYLFSKQYDKKKFKILNSFVGQDDRRFKKLGYFGMIKLMFNNYINRNNIDHFRRDTNYWN